MSVHEESIVLANKEFLWMVSDGQLDYSKDILVIFER